MDAPPPGRAGLMRASRSLDLHSWWLPSIFRTEHRAVPSRVFQQSIRLDPARLSQIARWQPRLTGMVELAQGLGLKIPSLGAFSTFLAVAWIHPESPSLLVRTGFSPDLNALVI